LSVTEHDWQFCGHAATAITAINQSQLFRVVRVIKSLQDALKVEK